MCGIFGFSDNEKLKTKNIPDYNPRIEKMEYRGGYDSAGLCILSEGKVLSHLKAVGRVYNLESKSIKYSSDSSEQGKLHQGITHTRWASQW